MNARKPRSEALQMARKEKEDADNSLEIVTNIRKGKNDGNVDTTMLKARDKEMMEMESKLTNLQMENHYLQLELAEKRQQVRRLSQTHEFYKFDDDESRRSSRTSVEFMNESNVKKLEAQVLSLEDALKDSRVQVAKSKSAHDHIETEFKRSRELNESLETQIDNLTAEKLMLKNDREALKAHVSMLSENVNELSSQLRAAQARIGGSSKRLDEHVEREKSRVVEVEKRAKKFKDAAVMWENSVRKYEVQVDELRNRARTTHAELVEERKIRNDLESQLHVLQQALKEEHNRIVMENQAREHSCLSHAGIGECPDAFRRPPMAQLDQLLRSTNVSRDYVNLKHDNLGQWRDTVLAEINDSLKLLYCFQRQVEAQRNAFVQEYAIHEKLQDITNFGEKENDNSNTNYSRQSEQQMDTTISRSSTRDKNNLNRAAQRNARKSPGMRLSPMSDARPPVPTSSSSGGKTRRSPMTGTRPTGPTSSISGVNRNSPMTFARPPKPSASSISGRKRDGRSKHSPA